MTTGGCRSAEVPSPGPTGISDPRVAREPPDGPGLGTSADLHPPVVIQLPAELFQALCHPWGPFLLRRQRAQCARGKSRSLVSAVDVGASHKPHVSAPRR